MLRIETSQKPEIEILNIAGQIIKNIYPNESHTTIDISEFPCGLYFNKVKSNDGFAVKKFIKE